MRKFVKCKGIASQFRLAVTATNKARFVLYVASIVAVILLFVPLTAEARQLGRTYTIDIEVECLDEAQAAIAELAGFNVDSSASLRGGQRTQRTARYTRRVDDWAFRHTQEVLRGLGDVITENERARYLGADIANVETRLLVLAQEIDRLQIMMSASTSLEVLIAVNDRLTWVTHDRDALIGRRNLLLAEAGSVVVHINLIEPPALPPPPEPGSTFGQRISASFADSWDDTLFYGGELLVFLARAGLPFVLFVLFLGAVIFITVKIANKYLPNNVKNAEEAVNNEKK